MANAIKVDGSILPVVNVLSCGPGRTPHTYVVRGACGLFEVTNAGRIGWIVEDGSTWIPELSLYGRRVTVEIV